MNARPLWHFLLSLSLVATSACSKKPAPSAEDTPAFQAANNSIPAAPAPADKPADKPLPARPSPDAIAWGDGISVTTAEFERAVRQGVFFTTDEGLFTDGAIPDEALSRAYLQLSVSRGLVSMKLLELEAQRRGISPSPEDVEAFIKSHNSLARFASTPFKASDGREIPHPWDRYGVTRDDLVQVARGLLLQDRIRDALVADLAKEDLWDSYRVANTRRRLLIAHSPNIPTSDEIDKLIARDEAQPKSSITEYFERNKRLYLSPRTIKLTMLSAPYGSDITKWRDPLAKAAERLKAGEPEAQIAKDLKLTLQKDVSLVRQENSIAFQAKVGDTGYAEYGPRGIYAWRLDATEESKLPELDRPLRREIAATLLQHQLTNNAKNLHAELAELLAKLPVNDVGDVPPADLDALRKKFADSDVQLLVTEPFPASPDGFIPGAGLVEPLSKAAFSLSMAAPMLPSPVVSRQRVYSARLLDQEEASKDAYEAERAAWTKKTQDQRAPTILEATIGDLREQRQVQVDLEPLRVKFGRQDKGTPNNDAAPTP
jgi:hypothetical protein